MDALKPKDPRTKAKWNIISRLLFLWLEPLVWLGFRQRLTQEDLYAYPQEADSAKMLKTFNWYWQKAAENGRGKKPRLIIVLFRCMFWRIILKGILSSLKVTVFTCQALLLGYLSEYFTIENPSEIDTRNAYLYAFGLVSCSLIAMLVHAHQFLLAYTLGMMTRTLMTAVIYQKVLSLNQLTVGRISIGHIINLASNDVQRFELAFLHPHSVWIAPIHLAVTTYLIYLELGLSTLIVVGFVLFQIPFQVLLAKIFTYYRLKSSLVTDKRARIMNEIISGIRAIKMYAWEFAFKKAITKLRRLESILILKGGMIRASNIAFVIMSPALLSFVLFSVYTGTGGILTPRKLFTSLALLNVLRLASVHEVILNVVGMSEVHVASIRIQKFLWLENCCNTKEKKVYEGDPDCSDPEVIVKNLSACWNTDDKRNVLNDISFEVTMHKPLLSVVGPVGSGKSALLQCLLGELEPREGTVQTRGRISYASQEPWIFSASLRENILFGSPYRPDWYNNVIEACALNKDIDQLVDGDMTLVGERGVTLSGGQKARVSLARAVYHDADTYLLDDPLSAVDTAVAKHLFEQCICGILKNHIVILVTHQVQFALNSDNILFLREGNVEMYGCHEALLKQGYKVETLLGLLKTDPQLQAKEYHGSGYASRPHSLSSLERDDFGGNFHVSQVAIPYDSHSAVTLSSLSLHTNISEVAECQQEGLSTITQPLEESAHGSLSLKTYLHYFTAGGNVVTLLIVILVFIVGEGSLVVSDWWIADWAQCAPKNISNFTEDVNSSLTTCSLTTHQRISVFIGTTASIIVLNLSRAIMFYSICINASRVLHNRMFISVLRAPVLFFDTNPIGRVLNRFSKDVGFLDDLLPYLFCEYLLWFSRVTSVFIITIIAIPWIIVPCSIMLILFLLLRMYYMKTAREIKRIEALARSPIYSHISTSLQGLPIIRAFQKETLLMKDFHSYQNKHTQSFYLYQVLARWLGTRSDLLTSAFQAVFAFAAVGLSSDSNSALIGLALTYCLFLTSTCQYVVKQSAEVENIMISAERIIGYSNLKSEAPLETLPTSQAPSPCWPSKGQLSLQDVSFQYSRELPMVLKNLDFTVKPGEKVGVVGRTGAGKSSLLSVLFRLAEPHGQIIIDGVDIQRIGLHDLRSKISIIPQDPVLFSGTMRYNLDPFDKFSDSDLWDVLEQVQLKVVVEQLEGQLSGEVLEGGSNFSVGQKQLVCLARALLRKNKILILDEATANVDMRTDDVIQKSICKNFRDCTVITIAHRLNTIMDSDTLLVLDNGEIKEIGTPHNLLQDSNSLLSTMVSKTGRVASYQLRKIAKAHSVYYISTVCDLNYSIIYYNNYSSY